MSDLISRADAIETVCRTRCGDKAKGCPAHSCLVVEEFDALPSADTVSCEFYNDAVKANIRILMENKELKEQIESTEAVTIHEDGTLEVKVPNAQKVSRVLVMDTESHIGGGLFYPDDADWIPCSERLPSEGEEIIISVCDDGGDTPYWYTAAGWRCEKYWISDNDYVIGVVTAWMPLPKPYREESEVKE